MNAAASPLPALAPPPRRLREIVTPEGVPLRLEVASGGDRVVAVALDLLLLTVSFALLLLVTYFVFPASAWLEAVAIVAFFLLRNFYFTWFEIRHNGMTPGKKRLGIRVVARRGGPLTAEAVFARNFTREVEIFMPLMFAWFPEHLFASMLPAVGILAYGWVAAFLAVPLINRDHLRLGDLIAGTMVVMIPKARLLPELGQTEDQHYAFSEQQLSYYGIYELQVLEELLRSHADAHSRQVVCKKIQKKIGWQSKENADPKRFLAEFYAAQRAYLERRMLFGRRKSDKKDREG